MNKDFLQLTGIVKKVLPAGNFEVELLENNKLIKASLAGKSRSKRRRLLIMEGCKVSIRISPYDFSKGEITEILPGQ